MLTDSQSLHFSQVSASLCNMFKQILLCFLVGFAAAASSDYAWKSNTRYEYDVQARTLAGLHEVADQYAGVLVQAKLSLQRRAEGVLIGRISKAQYAQVHSVLPDGWDSEIPEDKLNYQQLPLTQKPFEVRFKNGTVQELIVERDISNWEANVIKSIVSQIQVDAQGENIVPSRYNRFGDNDAMFKTMEDTVTGKCLTVYDINELPEYILTSKPELVPMPQLKGEGDIIEVVKTLNYSDCQERVAYHFGLHEMKGMEPSSTQMGDYFLRSSVSRVILSGSLKRHTIQSSVTTNKVVIKPTPSSNQKGMVVSQMNITLVDVTSIEQEPQQLSQPKNIGNLVYTYNSPFAQSNQVREGSQNSEEERSDDFDRSSEESQPNWNKRHPRSLKYQHSQDQYNQESDSQESSQEQKWQQDKPSMTNEPETPLLPYFIGYYGQAIKTSKQINPIEAAKKLAQKIARELEQPSDIPKEDTLAKFTILVKLVRTMNVKEIEEVSRELYTDSNKEVSYHVDAWKTYRDAVAQAGTGPALVAIQNWILSKKIQGQEAATILATLVHNTRYPTQEYMKTLFNLVTKSEVQKQKYLNDTAILTFSDLARKVVVDDETSHNEYPVHAFGKFNKENEQLVKHELIPYLKQKLERAIDQAESHKIHVYIRALGNVAHREILAAFEPYLEGDKQASQFQRLFMVMSLDQLTQHHPKTAQTILYKIYQNQGEQTEIRVAAVCQLMRTYPSTSMLQRMAEMTNEDSDDDVNSAVKSFIEQAAQLQDDDFSDRAQAAQPLLNPQTFGTQYSKQLLKDYVAREMNIVYKQYASMIGSEDSILPQGIWYSLRSNLDGVQRQYINLVAMVSSVDQLFEVFQQQTEKYQPEQYLSAKKDSKYASEQIAKLLNIDEDLSEELEGNMLLCLGQVKRFFTFDNQTIEQLPEYLKELSGDLRKGVTFNYTKWLNPRELTLSFPTVMGIPFVYTLETPVLLSLNGEVRAKIQPELVSKNEIRMPEYLNLTSEIEVLVSAKTQSKIAFVTPFDHQQYIAGYDKYVQINLPVESKLDIDFENNNVTMEVRAIDRDEEIFHYSQTPYTAKRDLLQLKPVSQLPTSKIVHVRDVQQIKTIVGEKKGLAFRVKYTGEQKHMDMHNIYETYMQHQGLSSLLAPLTEDYLTPLNLTVEYDSERSSAKSVVFQMSWNQTHVSGKQQHEQPSFDDIFEMRQEVEQHQEKRQEYFLKKSFKGISSVDASVFDMSFQIRGKKQPLTTYNATVAVARSPVDKHSRVIFYLNKEAEHERDFQVCAVAHNQFPNTNGLDYEYALEFDPTSTMNLQLAYGEQCKSGSKITLKGKLHQSEERKQYLKHDPMARVCKKEMQEGNKQLEGCRNMTTRANFMDRLTLDIHTENLSQQVRNVTYKIYSMARYMGFHYLDEDLFEGHGQKNQIKFQTRVSPDYKSMNLSLITEGTKTEYKNIRVGQWLRQVVAVHPVFPVQDRIYGHAQQTYFRPTCVIDQTATNTFDNVTYPINLGKTWHVVMHYLANSQYQKDREERFESEDDYDYVVLARESGNGKKEIKIVVNDAKNYWEIDMLPEQTEKHQLGRVLVNGKQINFDNEHSYDIEDAEIAQVYALPNGEIKIELNNDMYLIYDGERVKLTTTSDKYRGDVRGLCGTFDGQQATDFTTPKQCVMEDERLFAATYAVIDETAQGPAAELQKKAQKAPCHEKQVLYSEYITRKDIHGKKHQERQQENSEHERRSGHNSCSKHQTQYVEEEQTNEICFTIRPVPVCRDPCRPAKKIVKNVEVHCVQKSNVAEMWKKQIDMGTSPDFSMKPVHKQIKIKVAQTCAA